MSRRRRCCECPGDDPGGGGGDCVPLPDILGGVGLDGGGGPCSTIVDVHYWVTPGEGSIPDLFRTDTVWTTCPDYTVITIVYYRILSVTATRKTIPAVGPETPEVDVPVCAPGGEPGSGTLPVCAVGCDGDPLVGAFVFMWSDDPSGPFSSPPLTDGPDPMPTATGEDGCVTLNYPAGLDPGAAVSITVGYPPEYKATTLTSTLADLSAGALIAPDVADGYTCCDLDFRKGPINPSGAPDTPRGTTLSCITSGGTTRSIVVDCDGTTCSLSDEIEPTGGPPTREVCPGGVGSDADWDYWLQPTLTANRVPILIRVRWDGTDWHCSVKARMTVARPPRPDLGGCAGDPTQQISDFYSWFRLDAECSGTPTPELSTPPDPVLSWPYGSDPDGGSWYSGSTADVTVDASSYTVNANNPVDVTFHFDPVPIAVHGGTVNISIVDSITVWQP